MEPRFKLISSADADTFETRLGGFVASLKAGDLIVDLEFSTAPQTGGGVIFSALVHYQHTGSWHDRAPE